MSSRRGTLVPRAVALTLGCLLCAASTAGAARKQPEWTWTHPEIERFALPRIAILPAVPVEGGLDVCPFVEKRWMSSASGPRMRWLPAVLTRPRLEKGGSDSLMRRLAIEVLKTGRVDSTNAPGLARTLGVRALLSLRIDLWRRESSTVPGHSRAVVGLTGALVDSTGALLWSASGRGEYEASSVSAFTDEFGQAPADYDSALSGLVGRWATAVSAMPAAAPASKGP
jgi:hypothetical protein